ncbi:cytochrome c [Muricoccus radiodurans]|uniref:cytochrome c n=1 Tax=Muricoccus radiodurans TaxID=2231721 RepID=UPI003CF8398A
MPLRAATLFAALAVPLLGTGLALAQTDPITARKDGLRRMQGHLEAINAAARAGGDTRALTERTADMVAFYRSFPTLFPPGSDTPPSRALPTVWTDRAGFEAADANAVAAAEALNAAAASGDAAATGRAAQAMGAACGNCHRGYRGR